VALQARLPVSPSELVRISAELAMARQDKRVVLFNAGGPIFTFHEDDAEARRLAVAMVSQPGMGLAPPKALAEALGIHRSMVFEYRDRFAEGGAAALRTQKAGPKAPHKLAGERLQRAQALLDKGASNSAIARAVEVSEGAIRHALKQGRLRRIETAAPATPLKGPRARNEEDRTSQGGVAVKRQEERALAAIGLLPEAAPSFTAAESVAKAGVLVALPAIVAQGLYEVGQQVYGALKNGYYGLNAVLSTLVFMALLRIKNIEQLPSHAPGEFGLVLGLDRSPEVKTLRRKLAEMAGYDKGLELQAAFADRWVAEQPELLGFLYVDGHVRPYHGRKHSLPKTHVPRRRLCMPATTDYWVNDAFADPLFFVTAPGNEGLLAVLEEAVLPEVRELAGSRRVTLVLDRECWSPKSFKQWSEEGFDVMTYRKGNYAPWPHEAFTQHESRGFGKRSVFYQLAEQPLTLSSGLEVREVRCLTDTGHQTSVVTTRMDLSTVEIAERMFSRWRQENFFRYMRHEFALDHLPAYAVEAADPERMIPNPTKKQMQKELKALRNKIGVRKQEYGESVLPDSPASRERQAELRELVAEAQARLEQLRDEYRALPSHVAVGQVRDPQTVVQLEQERKILVDQIKMVAYRAETELANIVGPLLGYHHDDEARSFLRQVFQLPADIVPDYSAGILRVRLHGMANWRSNRALAGLCQFLNSYDTCYPGTDLRLILEPPPAPAPPASES
jgi:transposase